MVEFLICISDQYDRNYLRTEKLYKHRVYIITLNQTNSRIKIHPHLHQLRINHITRIMLRPIILKELLNLYRPQFKVFLYHFSQGGSCFLDFLFAKTTIIVLFYVGIFGFFPPVDGLIGVVFL